MSELKSAPTIQSLQVGFQIIDYIASREQPLKFNEIHEGTQITKSNLYKYLNTLTQQDILFRDKETGLFSLGSKLIQLGMTAVNRENVMDKASAVLHEINKRCQCTALLATWSPNGPMAVKIINQQQGLNIGAQIGTLLPLLSASGKIFAAYKEPYVIEEWMAKQYATLTDGQKQSLKRELEQVRKDGISFANEPLVASISSAAVPILNYAGELLGAIVLVGFAAQMPMKLDDEFSVYLLQESRELSRSFGCKQEAPAPQ